MAATSKILGLTKAEQSIMDATGFGSINVSDIARHTGIPRTSLLYMLKKLERRSLVHKTRNGANILWASNAPAAIGELRNSKFTIYEGTTALWSIFDKITALPKNARLQGIQPDRSILNVVRKIPLDKLLRLNASIKKKAIITEAVVHEQSVNSITKALGTSGAKELFKSFVGRLEDYAKMPDEFANVESEIYIFNSSAYILNWNKEIGIGIHDKDTVALLTAMFSCVKEYGVRYSQNARMEKHITPPNTPENIPN